MSKHLKCTSCSYILKLAEQPVIGCPKCGDAKFSLTISETIGRQEESVTYLGTSLDGKEVLKGFAKKSLTKTGPTAGTDAWLEQMKDKTANPARYKKKVTLSDGTVSKDVDGPLTDQSLHGAQKKIS